SDWTFDAARSTLSFTARLPGGVEHAVVEGPAEWGVAMPSLASAPDGGVVASVMIRHLPSAAERRAPLIVTVIGKTGSVEETRRLD
ncbi:hypothetical protein, partial [Paenibacillus larvae]|uniref:hypothetical protein n=1 Tax=Paenibacillus larvae TaxID=1464 RepID=UPI0039FD186A